jgi:hypothetical protein
MDMDEDFEEPDEQPKSSQKRGRADHLAPWQFKKGQSGQSARPPCRQIQERVCQGKYLASLTDEDPLAYFEGMNKADIWRMAEGIRLTQLLSLARTAAPFRSKALKSLLSNETRDRGECQIRASLEDKKAIRSSYGRPRCWSLI